jgi:hypothetical protein
MAIRTQGDAIGYAAACLCLAKCNVSIGFLDNTHKGDAMNIINDLIGIIADQREYTP